MLEGHRRGERALARPTEKNCRHKLKPCLLISLVWRHHRSTTKYPVHVSLDPDLLHALPLWPVIGACGRDMQVSPCITAPFYILNHLLLARKRYRELYVIFGSANACLGSEINGKACPRRIDGSRVTVYLELRRHIRGRKTER